MSLPTALMGLAEATRRPWPRISLRAWERWPLPDGSQDPITDQTKTRKPRASSSLDRVPLPPLDKNFGERGDPVCCSQGCNSQQGNLAST